MRWTPPSPGVHPGSSISILLALGATLVATGCADPVVETTIQLPAMNQGGDFDTSCVTAIEVLAVGNEYDNSDSEWGWDCIDVTSAPATFKDVRAAMQGALDVKIPPSGLAGVQVFGRRGSCKVPENAPPGDLVFFANATYDGGDSLTIPLVASASCAQRPTTMRPVDILKLTTGTTKGDCAQAKVDDLDSYTEVGTMSPSLTQGLMYFGGFSTGTLSNGASTLTAQTQVGPTSCLAAFASNRTIEGLSCVAQGPAACAPGSELEAPVLDWMIATNSIDQVKKAKFPGMVYGAVVNATNQPVAGATIAVDPKHGEVVYVELAGSKLSPTGGTSTGASGLFIVYTDALVNLEITGAGVTRTITTGGLSVGYSAALVVMR